MDHKEFLAIFLGGGMGALSRWGVGKVCSFYPSMLQCPTLICNCTGCLLIGFGSQFLKYTPSLRLGLLVGFVASYTTFSTFILEVCQQIQSRQYVSATQNIILSLTLGLLLTFIGVRVATVCNPLHR